MREVVLTSDGVVRPRHRVRAVRAHRGQASRCTRRRRRRLLRLHPWNPFRSRRQRSCLSQQLQLVNLRRRTDRPRRRRRRYLRRHLQPARWWGCRCTNHHPRGRTRRGRQSRRGRWGQGQYRWSLPQRQRILEIIIAARARSLILLPYFFIAFAWAFCKGDPATHGLPHLLHMFL